MNQWQKAQEALKLKTLSSAELGRLGVSRTSLQRWVAEGRLVRLSSGLYGLQELPITENYSLLSANLQIPSGVICLISALMYHGVTTQLSGDVWIALQGRSHCPRFDYPKIRVHRFTGPAFLEGIEEHWVEGGVLRVYSIEKTIVDLFRLRNKVGLDVALEALKDGLRTKKAKLGRIHELAKKNAHLHGYAALHRGRGFGLNLVTYLLTTDCSIVQYLLYSFICATCRKPRSHQSNSLP